MKNENEIKNKVMVEITEHQLSTILKALDFYSRVGIGQFSEIPEHPTFQRIRSEKFKDEKGKTDYGLYHKETQVIESLLHIPRNMLIDRDDLSFNGSFGIGADKVDDSCRQAFDILQDIRHYFWLQNPKRSSITVDSSVMYFSDEIISPIKLKKMSSKKD